MTRQQAITDFWDSFSVPAYPVTNVPDENKRPVAYITYQNPTSDFYGGDQYSQVNVWYRTTSEKKINSIVSEIEGAIPMGGKVVPYDSGAIWLKRGNPWCQAMADEDPEIKRRFLTISVEDWRS